MSFDPINIKEAGYIYVYLSYENESNNYVFFDDFKVTHAKTNILQYNEYYPFGLQTAASWTRENNTGNNFLYNAGNELNSNTQWYEMFYRGYDPVLGRMLQVDPYASSFGSLTPYNYAGNSPVIMNDPSGGYMRSNSDTDPAYFGEYLPRVWYTVNGGKWTRHEGNNFDFGGSGTSSGGDYSSFWAAVLKLPDGTYLQNNGNGTFGGFAITVVGGFYGYEKDGTPISIDGINGAFEAIDVSLSYAQTNGGTSKDPYDGHSFSISGNITLGGGVNFSLGVVWNKEGDWKIYGSGGPSFGVDASIGVSINSITNNKRERFDPNQYGGWGSSHNIALTLIDVVLIGGDNSPNMSTGTMGSTYTESGGGVSFGLPLGYTYQTSYTFFPGDWFKKPK